MLLLPHLNKARELARLAALHARRELEQGHVEAAAEDAAAILALGRHVGSEPIVISILVRYSIESIAVDLLASYLPEMQSTRPRNRVHLRGAAAGGDAPGARTSPWRRNSRSGGWSRS